MKKKIMLENFAGDVVKADLAKKIVGGYDGGWEGTQTSTSSGTTYTTGLWTSDADCSNDGDSYPSC